MKWYALLHVDASAPDEMVMTAKVPSGSPWFSGHFPGEPILPGIAQLDMVKDAVSRLRQTPFKISGVKKVRFKRVVKPEELLKITVVPKKGEDLSYVFRITVEGEQVSNGLMTVEPLQGAFSVKGPGFHGYGLRGVDMQTEKEKTGRIQRIAEIMINELKLEEVTPATFDPDMDLVDEVGIDSMDLATVALVLQDEYGIRIDEDDYPKLTTVRLIAEYIEEKFSE